MVHTLTMNNLQKAYKEMTPIEIAEYKQQWKPGYCVAIHSDNVDSAKKWCRKNLNRHEWSMSEWTNVYEHTFHFEDSLVGLNFKEWIKNSSKT